MTRCRSLIRDRPAMIPQFLLYQAQSASNKVQGKRGETVCRRGASVGSGREADQSPSLRSPPPDLSSVFRFLMGKKKKTTLPLTFTLLKKLGLPMGKAENKRLQSFICVHRDCWHPTRWSSPDSVPVWPLPWPSLGLQRLYLFFSVYFVVLVSFNLEKVMATHSSILAYKIPRTEQAGGLHHRIGHDWAAETPFKH